MKKLTGVVVAAGLTVVLTGIAAADDGADVKIKLREACKSAHSFQMALSGSMGMSGTITIAGPARSKMEMQVGPMTTTSIVAGGYVYVQMNGGPWQTHPLPAANATKLSSQLKIIADDAMLTVLPDRTENGIAVGAFTMTMPVALPTSATSVTGGPPMTTTCTYDKTTMLPRSCTSTLPQSGMTTTMTYSHWNDPANVVNVPAGVLAPSPTPTSAVPLTSGA